MNDDLAQRLSDVLEHFGLEMMRHETPRKRWEKLPLIVLDHRKFCVLCQVNGELRELQKTEPPGEDG